MGDEPGAVAANADKGRRRWHFGSTIFDERTLELLVEGVDAELERKPLEVLIYLLEHAGEVCTKDEILSGVWPGRILSETVLTKCIGRLRDALRDRNQEIIKTAYGFGYRFIAPVQIEVERLPGPGRFDLKPGDHPPGRPLWSLIERLGIGGHGETWRARHEKTHEQRVFKFALDESSLGVLKREITLFRILNDVLGERARVVRLLDWNLQQLPYFTEAEYVGAGNLIDWVKGIGGIAALPLAERVEIAAKIAAALAGVHAAGVLQMDLQPSHVFVKPVPGEPIDIALGNFGSGGMLDAGRIEGLGITRLGFTKTLAGSHVEASTSPYLAPEIAEGRPCTAKSDLYALGVILYQLLVGDFHKGLSADLLDIDDELLREDVASAVAPNPALRLADADLLAQRLRSLDERRRRLEAQRQRAAEARAARPHVEGSGASRVAGAWVCALLGLGLAVSTFFYVEERRTAQASAAAAAEASSVAAFLAEAALAPADAGTPAARLERIDAEIERRFGGAPRAAADLHYLIGRALSRSQEFPAAVRHLERAIELGREGGAVGSAAVLRSACDLIEIDARLGRLRDTLPKYEAVLAAGAASRSRDVSALRELQDCVARARARLGAVTPP
jgi:DNA-binding winged helix-turn-helix (wHTH) protein